MNLTHAGAGPEFKDMDLRHCTVCPKKCGADRTVRPGFCGSGAVPKIARAALHYGEEPCISGTAGSGTVFFSGCSLRCLFCQNYEVSRHSFGEEITVSRLAEIFRELEEQGANNINLVTPTHWAPVIAEALSLYRPGIPVLYNCGGYESVETLRRLEGLVNVWLPDIKYADPELARKFSGAPDYPETAYAAVEEMLRQCGHLQLDARGLAVRGVMIRHLVLPLHLKNSFAVLDRIAEQFGTETWVSLMFQYTPLREIQEYPELNRTLTRREWERAEAYLEEKGLLNGYVQEPDSKGTAFIPRFDLTGVR